MPLAAVAAIGAIGSLAGGAIASHGANQAAQTQANAGLTAAQIQANQDQKALDLQQQEFNVQQQNIAPWLSIGRGGLANLAYLTGLLPASSPSTTSSTPTGTPVNQTRTGLQAPLMTGRQDGSVGPVDPRQQVDYSLPGTASPYSSDYPLYGGNQPVLSAGTNGVPATGAAPVSAGSTDQYANLQGLINPNLGAAGSLLAPWTDKFTAPTDVTEQNDPGYQFRLNEGEKALERSAAGRGDILSGGTAKGLLKYGQDYASNEYGNVYNRALQQYQQNYNIFENNQANTFNRLAALSGVGQSAASQLNSAAQNYGNTGANILINSGNAQAQGINNAAAARASGYAASGNIWGAGINSATNSLSNLYLLSQLQNNPQSLLGSTDAETAANLYPCWVSRAVYGETNPLWLIARNRFEALAKVDPQYARLWERYVAHGERWAERVNASPKLFRVAKWFFDGLLNGVPA